MLSGAYEGAEPRAPLRLILVPRRREERSEIDDKALGQMSDCRHGVVRVERGHEAADEVIDSGGEGEVGCRTGLGDGDMRKSW